MKKIIMIISLVLALALCLCSCGEATLESFDFTAMNTYVSIKSAELDDAGKNDIKAIIEALDEKFDVFDEASELSKLNAANGGECSDELAQVLSTALEISAASDKYFNPCLLDLKNLWNIGDESAPVPSDAQIKAALKTAAPEKISGEDKKINLNGMKFDLGGIAKGFAADKAAAYLYDHDIGSAVISVGGTVLTFGEKSKDTPWTVSVQDPNGENGEELGTLTLRTAYTSTSGIYEQQKTVDGKTYTHVFDKNGYPIDNDLVSVTVVASNGMESDAYATALLAMGKERALEFIDKNNVRALLVTKDNEVVISATLKSKFTLTNENYKLTKHIIPYIEQTIAE